MKALKNDDSTLEMLLRALKEDLPLEIHGDGYIDMIGTDGVLDIVNKYCEYDCLVHNLKVAEERLNVQYENYINITKKLDKQIEELEEIVDMYEKLEDIDYEFDWDDNE
jgi:hypothetical protein